MDDLGFEGGLPFPRQGGASQDFAPIPEIGGLTGVAGHDGFWLLPMRGASAQSQIWEHFRSAPCWFETGGRWQLRIFIPKIDAALAFGFSRPRPDR
jgi:hypothetical protein